MRKITIISSVILALIFGNLQAQNENDAREKVSFGLKAGANFANVYDEQGEDFVAKTKLGFAGGAFVAVPIGRYLGIQPEVLFSQKGFRASGRILGNPYDVSRTLNYLDIPIFLAIKPAGFITLLAGPQYSYLIKKTDSFTSSNNNFQQIQDYQNNNIRKNTFGIVAGFDINIKHIVLGARAGWDLMHNNGDGSSTSPRYKNVWYQFTFGYRFF